MKYLVLSAALLFASMHAGAAFAQADIGGKYAADHAASDDVNTAIEGVIATMNPLLRPIARSRLRKTTPNVDTLIIQLDSGTITTRYDRRPVVTSPASGAMVKWTREDGAIFDVTTHWEGVCLVQTFRAEDRTRENRFFITPDGKTLTVYAKLSSWRLPRPVEYRLVFKRIQ